MTYRVSVETVVPVAPEVIFDYVADMENDPVWAPMVRSVKQIAGRGPAPGAVYRVGQWMGPGKVRDVDFTLTVLERPHRIEWRAVDRYMDYRSEMRFEAVDGGTRVVQDNRNILKRSRMPQWLGNLLARRQMRKQLRLLKRQMRRMASGRR